MKPPVLSTTPRRARTSRGRAKVEFQLVHAFAQGIAVARGKVLQPFGTRSQFGMQPSLGTAGRQAPQFHADDPARVIPHQTPGSGLNLRPHTVAQASRLQLRVQHRATLAPAYRAMATRGRRQLASVRRHQLIAGVIQKLAIGWIRGFATGRHAVGIGHAMPLQPGQVAGTVLAKPPQGSIVDHTLGFVLEIGEHRFGRVAEPSGLLLAGATAGVNHATAFGTGTAAGKTVGDQHVSTLGAGLKGGAGTGRPPADHQHITVVIPEHGVGIGHLQCRLDIGTCRFDSGWHGNSSTVGSNVIGRDIAERHGRPQGAARTGIAGAHDRRRAVANGI